MFCFECGPDGPYGNRLFKLVNYEKELGYRLRTMREFEGA